MAFGSGKNASFSLDDGGGTLRDISTYINNVQFKTDQGTYDVTTLGAAYRAFILGFSGGTFSITGFYDPTVDGYLAGADSVLSRSFEYYPAGTPVGATKPKYSGEVIKSSYSTEDPVDGPATFSLELTTTGAISRAVS